MKGTDRAFLMTWMMLFIYLVYDLSDSCVDILVAQNLFCRIHEKHIQAAFDSQVVLLLSITFAYSALQKIALHCALEELLWN